MRWLSLALAGALWFPCVASAQEDGDLRLMQEPHSYVDVADAFDDDDPFDLNVRLGFRHEYTYGNIQREGGSMSLPGDPNRGAQNWVDVAHFTHSRNILDLGLDVGIFRDLAIFGRLPIILSDDRHLGAVAGAANPAPYLQADADGDGDPSNDPPLFSVPFDSPTRSGLDYIEAGLMWSIFNQNRERELPTWLLMVSGRFNLGDPIIPCTAAAQGCRQWTESSGDWTYADGGADAGETRGTNALHIETRASWRAGYVEPYAGLQFQIEWAANAERFYLPAGNIRGFINDKPPILGEFTGGIAIHPWEDRSSYQRFTVDLRFMGRYTSEGRSYSPLFDALGTSNSPYLTNLNLEGSPDGTTDLRQVPFTGLTDTAPFASLGGRFGLEMRAARFVDFQLGAAVWYIEPHVITYTDACNPNADPNPPSPGPDGVLGTADDVHDARAGTCRRGIVNPHHRPAIDLPGRTFRQNESVQVELSFAVTGMF
ncbi:MAG: hypothetical protein H6719_10835 [Sandaracinaceae bacterium]|nr:hypothetical protein [Sandaracinaceae bacterium]